MKAWLRAFLGPSNLLQVLLVLATVSGIVFQYRLFNLELQYKELSVRPNLIDADVSRDFQVSAFNIGLGSAEITSISYESDSFQRLEFDRDSVLDTGTEDRIKTDLKMRALRGLIEAPFKGKLIPVDTDFLRPGSFVLKDQNWYFAIVRMAAFIEEIKNTTKSQADVVQFQNLVRTSLSSNKSTFRIELCYCSITRKECQHLNIGTRGTEKLSCHRWER